MKIALDTRLIEQRSVSVDHVSTQCIKHTQAVCLVLGCAEGSELLQPLSYFRVVLGINPRRVWIDLRFDRAVMRARRAEWTVPGCQDAAVAKRAPVSDRARVQERDIVTRAVEFVRTAGADHTASDNDNTLRHTSSIAFCISVSVWGYARRACLVTTQMLSPIVRRFRQSCLS